MALMNKKISDICIDLQGIQDHWDETRPILSVSSSNIRSGDQEYSGPEVRNIKPLGINIMDLR